jgi:hypothetical protein
MDALILAAAKALASGDPIGALNWITLRKDGPALALRGIAMARMGDFAAARTLLKNATRAFGPKEAAAKARCTVAEAEIALVSRDLNWPEAALADARGVLKDRGDRINEAYAGGLEIRRLLLIGRLDEAERKLAGLDPSPLPPALRAVHDLAVAGIALRRLRAGPARDALESARRCAMAAGIPALLAEIESAERLLSEPAARLVQRGVERPLLLEQIEPLLASPALVIDACRYRVGEISLARRPVLFTLLRALGEAWPGDLSRDALVARAFRAQRADDSHRVRLRVEIGRLRAELAPLAGIEATKNGFILQTDREVVLLLRPVEEPHAAMLAFLADGESWSSSALALALGASQRTVQRALEELSADAKIQSIGHGRARRWMTAPLPGFATSLLLTLPLPED